MQYSVFLVTVVPHASVLKLTAPNYGHSFISAIVSGIANYELTVGCFLTEMYTNCFYTFLDITQKKKFSLTVVHVGRQVP